MEAFYVAYSHSESPQETSVRCITISRGMPAPITQMAIVTRGGTFYADLGWRWVLESPDGARTVWTVLVEYDGEVKYLPSGGVTAKKPPGPSSPRSGGRLSSGGTPARSWSGCPRKTPAPPAASSPGSPPLSRPRYGPRSVSNRSPSFSSVRPRAPEARLAPSSASTRPFNSTKADHRTGPYVLRGVRKGELDERGGEPGVRSRGAGGAWGRAASPWRP